MSIKLNLEQAGREFGCSKETLRRNIRKLGMPSGRGHEYTIAEIYRALVGGDLAEEKLRGQQLDNELKQIEIDKEKRSLISLDEATSFIIQTFAPVREAVVSMPGQLAALTNPADPEHARGHLRAWAEQFLKRCREFTPDPTTAPEQPEEDTDEEAEEEPSE